MSADLTVAAVDLGASSGRVMAGRVGTGSLDLLEVHRFVNGPVRIGPTLHWDVLGLYREVLHGLSIAAREHDLAGIGIDSWAIDYGLLDASGALLGNPVHYRDNRTAGVLECVLKTVSADELYAVTGLPQLPFNTIYQLVSALGTEQFVAADRLLLIPDLLGYWLTGQVGAEATNASTTQLYDVRARTWATDLAERVGIPNRILPPLREAGDIVGNLLPDVAADLGLRSTIPVVAVGSHDTASSVVAIPAAPGGRFAYISSGTWSLVGVELDAPARRRPGTRCPTRCRRSVHPEPQGWPPQMKRCRGNRPQPPGSSIAGRGRLQRRGADCRRCPLPLAAEAGCALVCQPARQGPWPTSGRGRHTAGWLRRSSPRRRPDP